MGTLIHVLIGWTILSFLTAWGLARWFKYQRSQDEIDEIMIRYLEEREHRSNGVA